MKSVRHRLAKALLLTSMVAVSPILAADLLIAQNRDVGSGFQLSPGVLVNVSRGEAYVMTPEGGISAVNLSVGKEVWHTNRAAKPLALSGDLVWSKN